MSGALFVENAVADGSTRLTTALVPVYVSGVLAAFKEVLYRQYNNNYSIQCNLILLLNFLL